MPKIEQTANGKYRTRLYIGKDPSGRKHWKSFTHEDKTVLKRIVAEYENIHKEYREYKTFGSAAEVYIDAREAVLSPYTIKTYTNTLDAIKTRYAAFCALKLDNIKASDIQGIINDLITGGKRPKYVKNIISFIKAVLKSEDIPAPSVRLPEVMPPDLYEPTIEDIKRIIAASAGTVLEIPILLGIHGLRRGEICALKYPEDFNDNVIHVHKSAVYLGSGTRTDKSPKNKTSDRFVPLNPALIEKIAARGYIYSGQPQTLTGSFNKFIRRNNLPPIRFHDLRHFFAAYAHTFLTDAEILKIGGWKTDNVMKRVYRYALDEQTEEKLNSAISTLL